MLAPTERAPLRGHTGDAGHASGAFYVDARASHVTAHPVTVRAPLAPRHASIEEIAAVVALVVVLVAFFVIAFRARKRW